MKSAIQQHLPIFFCKRKRRQTASLISYSPLNCFTTLLIDSLNSSSEEFSNTINSLILSGLLKLQPAIYSSQCSNFYVSRSELRLIILSLHTSTRVFTQITTSSAPCFAKRSLKESRYSSSRISSVNGALINTVSL